MMICEREKCLSCLACVDACSVCAINVDFDYRYGLFPTINKEKCINCGKCKKVCPVINCQTKMQAEYSIAAYTKNKDDQKTCASGGIATAFARKVIARNGIVFGASVVDGIPKMISVDTMDDIEKLKGSKYVFCNPMGIYSAVDKQLKKGRECLFIGTPCQIAALRQYLGKEYDNLTTIDLICHGTPPYELLKEHFVNQKLDIGRIKSFSFRGKYDFYLTVYAENEEILYQKVQYVDRYFTAFMRGIMFREVCYECKFAESHRVGDITIGDYWGIDKGAMENYKGKISLILLNTSKGKNFFKSSNQDVKYEIRDISEAISGNDQLRTPSKRPAERDLFIETLLKENDLSHAFGVSGINRIVTKNTVRNKILFLPRAIKEIIKGN